MDIDEQMSNLMFGLSTLETLDREHQNKDVIVLGKMVKKDIDEDTINLLHREYIPKLSARLIGNKMVFRMIGRDILEALGKERIKEIVESVDTNKNRNLYWSSEVNWEEVVDM